MIEHGIIRALTGSKDKTGVYVQQMPYPCYVDDMYVSTFDVNVRSFLSLLYFTPSVDVLTVSVCCVDSCV